MSRRSTPKRRQHQHSRRTKIQQLQTDLNKTHRLPTPTDADFESSEVKWPSAWLHLTVEQRHKALVTAQGIERSQYPLILDPEGEDYRQLTIQSPQALAYYFASTCFELVISKLQQTDFNDQDAGKMAVESTQHQIDAVRAFFLASSAGQDGDRFAKNGIGYVDNFVNNIYKPLRDLKIRQTDETLAAQAEGRMLSTPTDADFQSSGVKWPADWNALSIDDRSRAILQFRNKYGRYVFHADDYPLSIDFRSERECSYTLHIESPMAYAYFHAGSHFECADQHLQKIDYTDPVSSARLLESVKERIEKVEEILHHAIGRKYDGESLEVTAAAVDRADEFIHKSVTSLHNNLAIRQSRLACSRNSLAFFEFRVQNTVKLNRIRELLEKFVEVFDGYLSFKGQKEKPQLPNQGANSNRRLHF